MTESKDCTSQALKNAEKKLSKKKFHALKKRCGK